MQSRFDINYMISLGAWGGYVVAGFDHSVDNSGGGVDLAIRGNPYSYQSEPGVVWVAQDENGDGEPNDTWYELAGSDYWLSTTKRNAQMTYYNPNYDKRYTVPWTLKYTDKDGKEQMEAGAVLTSSTSNPTIPTRSISVATETL